MKPDDKLKLVIKLNDKMLHCIVIQSNDNYEVLLYNMGIATIKLNQNEKWVQLSGPSLPEEFIGEIGSNIEATHRQELFADN
jgi:hypothetical protein